MPLDLNSGIFRARQCLEEIVGDPKQIHPVMTRLAFELILEDRTTMVIEDLLHVLEQMAELDCRDGMKTHQRSLPLTDPTIRTVIALQAYRDAVLTRLPPCLLSYQFPACGT